jgi:hypothetical protein
MKYVVLALAVAVIGAGIGLVPVGTAQAHGGLGYGDETQTTLICVPSLAGNAGVLPCETVRDGGYKF